MQGGGCLEYDSGADSAPALFFPRISQMESVVKMITIGEFTPAEHCLTTGFILRKILKDVCCDKTENKDKK